MLVIPTGQELLFVSSRPNIDAEKVEHSLLRLFCQRQSVEEFLVKVLVQKELWAI